MKLFDEFITGFKDGVKVFFSPLKNKAVWAAAIVLVLLFIWLGL